MNKRPILSYAIKDIPNTDGYRFTGVFLDGSVEPCIVRLNDDKTHSVFRERDEEPCWFKLISWSPIS